VPNRGHCPITGNTAAEKDTVETPHKAGKQDRAKDSRTASIGSFLAVRCQGERE